MARLDNVIKNLRERPDYVIGYRAPKYLRIKLAKILESGEFRELSELLNTAITEWLNMREKKTAKETIIDILKKDENLRKEVLEAFREG